MVLQKFPCACPYCLKKPCSCWNGEKPTISDEDLRNAFFQNAPKAGRSINHFQMMFREIYSHSWASDGEAKLIAIEQQKKLFVRLIEEVAEVGEAIRFHHLYPENFDNEMSDLMAWWFGLVSTFPSNASEGSILAEDLLWSEYPGHCKVCKMVPCLCRPGPVRQLMSRPIPGHDHRFDSLTSLLNQAAYNEDIKAVEDNKMALTYPSACVRLDVDKFKSVNDTHGHAAGDEALRHIATVARGIVRERDRLYRISGDEFGVLCVNFTEEEATGAMKRLCAALAASPVRWVSRDGQISEFNVSVSIGVAEFSSPSDVAKCFELADQAAYQSKSAGRAKVSRASELKQ
jgi:diguanylate cyclase (GGDEF)-like protein